MADPDSKLGAVATAPFVCECGVAPVREGDYWVCRTSSCDGYEQTCGTLTAEQKRSADAIAALRF